MYFVARPLLAKGLRLHRHQAAVSTSNSVASLHVFHYWLASDDDEPAMSAFGYDITSKYDCNNDTAATQEVEDIVASVFPDG